MANIKSAIKRARQNTKRRMHNASQRSTLRTYIKKVLHAITEGKHDTAMAEFKTAQSVIDKSASKGLIHKNRAARYKRRLNLKIKNLAS